MCRLVQHVILSDDEAALCRVMPYLKCLNYFILDEKVPKPCAPELLLAVRSCADCGLFAGPAAKKDEGLPQLAH